jgi:hypothetical protein
MSLQVLSIKENPFLPLIQSKSLINKHVDCIGDSFNIYKITQPNINDGDIRSEDITMKFKKMKIDYCLRMNKYFHIK